MAPKSLIVQAREAARWAALVYNHGELWPSCKEQPDEPLCESSNWSGMKDIKWIKVSELDDEDANAYDVLAFIADPAEGEENKRIVISFKGTDNMGMIWDAVKGLGLGDLSPVRSVCPLCKTITPYLAASRALWPQVKSFIKVSRRKYPGASIVYTGHSVGGFLAILAAAHAQKSSAFADFDFDKFSLFAFATPRVGNAEFVEAYKDMPVQRNSWVVINCADPVPAIPSFSQGYRHISNFGPDGTDAPKQIFLTCPFNPFAQSGKVKLMNHVILSCGVTYPYSKSKKDSCQYNYTETDPAKLTDLHISMHKMLPYRVALGDQILKRDYDRVVKYYTDDLKWKLGSGKVEVDKKTGKIKGNDR